MPLLFYPKLTYLMCGFNVRQGNLGLIFFISPSIILVLENVIINTDNLDF